MQTIQGTRCPVLRTLLTEAIYYSLFPSESMHYAKKKVIAQFYFVTQSEAFSSKVRPSFHGISVTWEIQMICSNNYYPS